MNKIFIIAAIICLVIQIKTVQSKAIDYESQEEDGKFGIKCEKISKNKVLNFDCDFRRRVVGWFVRARQKK
jgi:hypothetical protein